MSGSTTGSRTTAIPTAPSSPARLVALCVDADDPPGLARFWAAALGWEVAAPGPGSGSGPELVPTDGTRFTLRFAPARAPKAGKNPIHLDLTTTSIDDQRSSVEQLVGLGARPVDIGQGPDDTHVVLADPEGNELCIIEPGNQFLAGCGRLGSITCDGSPAAGSFWSAALGWPLVWDQDEETAIRHPDGTGPMITWGPPVPPHDGPNRLHLDVAPAPGVAQRAEVERLVGLGARVLDVAPTHPTAPDALVLADPTATASACWAVSPARRCRCRRPRGRRRS